MLGFVGKKEYPFDLFTTSFKVNLEDDEEQRINFSQIETVDLEPYQSQSFDKYQLKAKSIIIRKIDGIISAELDKDYTYYSEETNISTLLDDSTESEDPNSVDNENQPALWPVKVITKENNVTRVNAGKN